MVMQILERGMETQRGKWQLLRVAIVEIRSFCYIGRAFFGDRETGAVAWDCDCRPSDAVWLAQKVSTPTPTNASWACDCSPLDPGSICVATPAFACAENL